MSLATLGMMLMISANDLMSLYVGLELQSLALYVIAAFQRDSVRSTEAGIKYFVLGSVASGMLLFGASLIYGFCGSTSFVQISQALLAGKAAEIGTTIGLVFVVAGLAFKIAAVPFHMWTPDVYEGAPTPVTAFFAVATKIAGVSLLVSVLMGPFKPLFPQWQQIIVVAAVLSMGWGAFAALRQPNIKRLMAYSSIANVGYVLLGVAAGSEKGIQSVVFYLAIYMVMTSRRVRHHPADEAAQRHGREHLRPRRPRPQPSDAGLVDDDHDVLAGRHPAARRVLGQAVRLHGGRRGQAVLAGRAGRAGLGRGVLLLPAHRQGDVLRRERARRSTRASPASTAPWPSRRRCWSRCSRCCRSRSAPLAAAAAKGLFP